MRLPEYARKSFTSLQREVAFESKWAFAPRTRQAMNIRYGERLPFGATKGTRLVQFRYLKVIKSVRLRVEAPVFKGSFAAFELL